MEDGNPRISPESDRSGRRGACSRISIRFKFEKCVRSSIRIITVVVAYSMLGEYPICKCASASAKARMSFILDCT